MATDKSLSTEMKEIEELSSFSTLQVNRKMMFRITKQIAQIRIPKARDFETVGFYFKAIACYLLVQTQSLRWVELFQNCLIPTKNPDQSRNWCNVIAARKHTFFPGYLIYSEYNLARTPREIPRRPPETTRILIGMHCSDWIFRRCAPIRVEISHRAAATLN